MTRFKTLGEFNTKLEGTRCTLNGKNLITLEEGLSSSVKHIQNVDTLGKKVIIIGNGGSAAIASHLTVDIWKNGGIRAVAFNDSSLLTCIANDLGYENLFSSSIEMFADKDDLLIAVSSSGNSMNIRNGVDAAKAKGCPVVTFSGFNPDNALSTMGDVNFYVDSGRYGTVEVAHTLLIHAIVDEVIEQKLESGKFQPVQERLKAQSTSQTQGLSS